jgi:hypothetical protein
MNEYELYLFSPCAAMMCFTFDGGGGGRSSSNSSSSSSKKVKQSRYTSWRRLGGEEV